jgi:hypothetical protein
MRDHLGEDGAAGIHPPLFRAGDSLLFGPKQGIDIFATTSAVFLKSS